MKAALRCLWLALLLCTASPAHALCVAPLCSCSVSTTSLAFGAYNPLANVNVDSTASVRISCGGVVGLLIPYDVALGPGGGTYGARRLTSGAATLNYNLYTSNTMATVWGDGSASTQILSGAILLDVLGWAPVQSHTVYGRIPLGQTGARPGVYGDTVSVTVTYF
jgi:spore coat protein U-like protein